MSDGYPEKKDIDLIIKHAGGRLGELTGNVNVRDLVYLLIELWRWDNYIDFTIDDNKEWSLNISTGGWSGHEEIVSALGMTFFWFLYWQSSQRGGHFTFKGKFNDTTQTKTS